MLKAKVIRLDQKADREKALGLKEAIRQDQKADREQDLEEYDHPVKGGQRVSIMTKEKANIQKAKKAYKAPLRRDAEGPQECNYLKVNIQRVKELEKVLFRPED